MKQIYGVKPSVKILLGVIEFTLLTAQNRDELLLLTTMMIMNSNRRINNEETLPARCLRD